MFVVVYGRNNNNNEIYQGGQGWDDWIARFENVVTVNGWDAEAKLNWIKVCLTGGAQKAFES